MNCRGRKVFPRRASIYHHFQAYLVNEGKGSSILRKVETLILSQLASHLHPTIACLMVSSNICTTQSMSARRDADRYIGVPRRRSDSSRVLETCQQSNPQPRQPLTTTTSTTHANFRRSLVLLRPRKVKYAQRDCLAHGSRAYAIQTPLASTS